MKALVSEKTDFSIGQPGLWIGIVAFVLMEAMPLPDGMSPEGQHVLAITVLMAIWWITEVMPLGVTALIPIVAFPILGVTSAANAGQAFGNSVNFLLLGGFFIGAALARWQLHTRIALVIINKLGSTTQALMLGFMLASFLLSMWISNVASTMMMVPIALSVIDRVFKYNQEEELKSKFSIGLMLAIAYSCNIGGLSTLIGTPSNAILAGIVEEIFGWQITFIDWFVLAFPLALILLATNWFFLTKIAYKVDLGKNNKGKAVIEEELEKLGEMKKPERGVLIILCATATCWVLRGMIDIEWVSRINDATIAVFFGSLLFVLPSGNKKGEKLLDWPSALKIPWGVLLLMGGGFTLAAAFVSTGLDLWVASQLEVLGNTPIFLIVLAVVVLTVFLTELTSNSATATIMVPLLAGMAAAMSIHPYALIMAAGFSAPLAFMLPMATPANSIVFSCEYLKVKHMARTGLVLNIVGIVSVPIIVLYLLPLVWGIDLSVFPD